MSQINCNDAFEKFNKLEEDDNYRSLTEYYIKLTIEPYTKIFHLKI